MMENRVLCNERGVQAIELALLLPIFLGILYGIVDFGFMMYQNQIVANASREGARAGIVLSYPRPTPEDISAIVCENLKNSGINPDLVTVNVDVQSAYADSTESDSSSGSQSFDSAFSAMSASESSSGGGGGSSVSGTGGSSGDYLSVDVTFNYEFQFLSKIIPSMPDVIPLTGKTVMQLE